MAKDNKKGNNKKPVINKIDSVKVEIDYERLANEIINAQIEAISKANEIDGPAYVLKVIMCVAFIAVGICLIIGAIVALSNIPTTSTLSDTIVYISAAFIFCVYGGVAIALAINLRKIRDKVYLVNYFSAIVALTALIVSIVGAVKI